MSAGECPSWCVEHEDQGDIHFGGNVETAAMDVQLAQTRDQLPEILFGSMSLSPADALRVSQALTKAVLDACLALPEPRR